MDNLIHEPLIQFIKNKYHVKYVDTMTEAGLCKILSDNRDNPLTKSIDNRITVSLSKHNSQMIFIPGHDGWAGNIVSEDIQIKQIVNSAKRFRRNYPNIKVIPFWIDQDWKAKEL